MAKKSNHKTVVFLEEFATKKAGEEWTCDGMLARTLVDQGVAEYASNVADNATFTIEVESVNPEQSLSEGAQDNSVDEKVSEPVVSEVEEPLPTTAIRNRGIDWSGN
jgi:hypothetical protein